MGACRTGLKDGGVGGKEEPSAQDCRDGSEGRGEREACFRRELEKPLLGAQVFSVR